ncbi:hypothetical protein CI102_6161 [Trichoderma harzianum]|uniref:Uncharacterized protein n=1 Tax=Trichoderma harzianum CBS 226.95 TaxID=983964 RepID=A0A2T4AHP1_TRIHA|nr:hypothetical protein M431DRAFT_381545 [Trichoderma harzianum CBS 226.95]PKK52005.1 hypothetical protein CI102_6161 [Trichoderma harzianum]PTB56566.1 hypothetical protein M431DRAFT_381545 [Trichoderma harzianum CBS 226.95]
MIDRRLQKRNFTTKYRQESSSASTQGETTKQASDSSTSSGGPPQTNQSMIDTQSNKSRIQREEAPSVSPPLKEIGIRKGPLAYPSLSPMRSPKGPHTYILSHPAPSTPNAKPPINFVDGREIRYAERSSLSCGHVESLGPFEPTACISQNHTERSAMPSRNNVMHCLNMPLVRLIPSI